MTAEDKLPQKPSFGRRMWLAFKNLVWFLFKLILIIVIIATLGAAIYLGGPILIEEYLLKDVRVNSNKIVAMQTQVVDSNEKYANRIGDLQSRLDTLEINQDDLTQAISEFETRLSAIEDKLSDQESSLNKLESQVANNENLGTPISLLLTRVPAINEDLEDLKDEINKQLLELEKSIDKNQAGINTLRTQIETQDTLDDLRQEIQLLKVMEMITRARVSIGQENIGLAKEDLQAATEILNNLRVEVSAAQALYLDEISQRLSLAIVNISDLPSLADEDLEVAWQLLLQGFPAETEPDEMEITQESGNEMDLNLTPSPTPTSTEILNPTPTQTPTPTQGP